MKKVKNTESTQLWSGAHRHAGLHHRPFLFRFDVNRLVLTYSVLFCIIFKRRPIYKLSKAAECNIIIIVQQPTYQRVSLEFLLAQRYFAFSVIKLMSWTPKRSVRNCLGLLFHGKKQGLENHKQRKTLFWVMTIMGMFSTIDIRTLV